MSFAGCDTLKCVSMSDQECNLSPAIININSNDILTKTWMSQNEPKPAKTTRNQPKRQKKNWKTTRNHPNSKIEEIWNILIGFEPKSPNLGILGQEVLTF